MNPNHNHNYDPNNNRTLSIKIPISGGCFVVSKKANVKKSYLKQLSLNISLLSKKCN